METFHPQHLSLHYDGVRISTVDAVSIADVCTQSEAYIKRMTGFEVRIREKTHKLVLQAMKEAAVAGPAVYAADDVLCKAGNCIPHALACLEMLEPGHMYMLNNGTDQNNVYICLHAAAWLAHLQAMHEHVWLFFLRSLADGRGSARRQVPTTL